MFPFTDIDGLIEQDQSCGYAAFREEYLTFPPTSVMPDINDLPGRKKLACLSLYESVYEEIQNYNPCFDIYNVAITCPVLWDVLGCRWLHS